MPRRSGPGVVVSDLQQRRQVVHNPLEQPHDLGPVPMPVAVEEFMCVQCFRRMHQAVRGSSGCRRRWESVTTAI